jgi:hypothetical protein
MDAAQKIGPKKLTFMRKKSDRITFCVISVAIRHFRLFQLDNSIKFDIVKPVFIIIWRSLFFRRSHGPTLKATAHMDVAAQAKTGVFLCTFTHFSPF